MSEKSLNRQSIEQRLWEIFLARCLLRNKGFVLDSVAFWKSTGIRDSKAMSRMIIASNSIAEKRRESKDSIDKSRLPAEFSALSDQELKNAEDEILKSRNELRNFLAKWGRRPLFEWEEEDDELKKKRILVKHERRDLLPEKSPIKLWSKELNNSSYVGIGIDFSYPLTDIIAKLKDFKNILNQSEYFVYLKKAEGTKKSLIRICENSIDGLNKIFEYYDHKHRGAYRIADTIMPREKKLYNDPRLLDPKFNAKKSEIQRKITFVKNCIRAVKKLISPPLAKPEYNS